jgi:hypothetical protein
VDTRVVQENLCFTFLRQHLNRSTNDVIVSEIPGPPCTSSEIDFDMFDEATGSVNDIQKCESAAQQEGENASYDMQMLC